MPPVIPPLKKKQSVKSTNQAEGKEDQEDAASASKTTDAIDDLLGGLSSDLEKIGVRTTTKGHCAYCNKSIVGKVGLPDKQKQSEY